MQKWEYLVVYIQDSKRAQDQPEMDHYLDADRYSEQLNKYGDAGWELIAFEWTTDGAKAALKRPKAASSTVSAKKPRASRKKDSTQL